MSIMHNYYDSLDRQVKVTQSNGLITETIYNSRGQVEKSIVRAGNDVRTTEYKYDMYGNIIETIQPDGTSIKAAYNNKGQKISETNQLGQTRTFEYDDNGQLIKVILPDGETYKYAYDAQGNQTSIIDPLGRETKFTYDDNGNQLTRTLPDGSTESFTYDHKGRLIKQTSFEGVIAVYTYDEFDRISSKTFYTNQAQYFTNTVGEIWTYEYDQFGRVTKINQNGRETITEYDAQGRTISVTTPEGKISYTYDAFGRQTSVQTDNDSPTIYSYDNFGHLSSVTSDGKTTTYEYDAFGNLARTKLPNGVVTTYEYDNMNRLVKETNFVDKNNNGAFDSGEGISQFDYTLDAQGRKTNAIEKFWADLDNDGVIDELFNNITWKYDNAGRLIYEEFDHYDNAFDQTQVWEYDLVSNRTLQKLDKGNDGIFDEITKYNYDVNDRLLEELFDGQNDGIFEKLTLYGYDHTQQTSKTVSENGVKTSETTYEYDLQGRMSVVTITTFNDDGSISRTERTSYDYGADGIRTSALHEIDANGDGTFETSKLTEYLNDPLNITGYSQVLKQTETNNETGEITITTYVIGHQRISQIVEKNGEKSEYYFTFDGHGSTRVLTDIAGVVVQLYAYDAFGNALGFDPSTALTEFLYSGEQFDAKIGQQYLRQRYYDPSTGRFNRLDPFFGNMSDPLSLHKYLYTHADPVNGIDPRGEFFAVAIGGLLGFGVGLGLSSAKNRSDLATGGYIMSRIYQMSRHSVLRVLAVAASMIGGYFGTYSIYGIYGNILNFKPLWAGGTHPNFNENLTLLEWENNIVKLLKDYVDSSTLSVEQKQEAKTEAEKIAKDYVQKMQNRANTLHLLVDSRDGKYGVSSRSTIAAWIDNWGDKNAYCSEWATDAVASARDSKYWTAIAHFDYSPMGDVSIGMFFRHSFMSLSLKDQNEKAFIFDAWSNAYPEVYDPRSYFEYYGIGGLGFDQQQQ